MRHLRWILAVGIVSMMSLFTACDEEFKNPDGFKTEIEAEFTRTFYVKYKDLMDEYKLEDIDLSKLNVGQDGKKGKILYHESWDYDLAEHLSADDASKIKVTALNVVKSRNGDGRDIKITNKREDGTSSGVDLSLFKGLSLLTKDPNTGKKVVIATVIGEGASKDEVYLEVKNENLLPYLEKEKGEIEVTVVTVNDGQLPNLSDLELAITVTTQFKVAQDVSSLIKDLKKKLDSIKW